MPMILLYNLTSLSVETDSETHLMIEKAIKAFRLPENRVWTERSIPMETKFCAYELCILSALIQLSENLDLEK